MSRPENRGLSPALDLLVEAKKEIDSKSKGGPISFADLIQFAGNCYFVLQRLSFLACLLSQNNDGFIAEPNL